MATVVNLERDTRFEDIGKAFGSSFGKGFERGRTKHENKQKKREMDALLNQLEVNNTTEPEDIFHVASQSDAFDDQEKVMKFVDFYIKSIQGAGGKISMQEVTIGGENKLLPMTNTDLLDARNRGLDEVLGLPAGTQADFGSSDPEDSVIILSLETGKEVRRLKKDGFDASKLGPNEATVDDFERKLKLFGEGRSRSAETRAKKKEKRDAEKHTAEQADSTLGIESDLQRRAQGQIIRRGEKVTSESLKKETSIVAAIDKWSGRIARAFGVSLSADGSIDAKFNDTAEGLRYDLAVTTFPDLIRGGLSDTVAFKASKRVANALEVGDKNEAKVPMKETKENILSPEFLDNLKKHDIGKVFKLKDDTGIYFAIYTGKPHPDAYIEVSP